MRHEKRRSNRRFAAAACLAVAALCGRDALALDLLTAYGFAVQNDATLQAARAEADASREALPQARAQLMPNVTGSLSKNKNALDQLFLGSRAATTNYESSNYVLQLRQPIFRKYNFALYQQAKAQVDNADANLTRNEQDMAVRLGGAYFEALMAQQQLDFVLAAKKAYATQLEGAKRSFKAGVGTRTDIDDAQARFDMAIAQELVATQNVSYTARQLQVLIDQPAVDLALLDPSRMDLKPPFPADPEEWIARGEEVNAELRAMRANVEAAEQEVSKARAGHLPTVDLVASRSREDSASTTSINRLYYNSSVGVQVNVPIFAGGYVNSQVRQAQANLEKFRQTYEARRREVGVQIRKEYQNVAEGVLKVKALEQAERSADQAVISNQKGFQAGTRTQVDILNAEQQRMNTRRDLAQARYEYIMARLRLQALVGSLNETEIAAVNAWLAGPAAVAATASASR